MVFSLFCSVGVLVVVTALACRLATWATTLNINIYALGWYCAGVYFYLLCFSTFAVPPTTARHFLFISHGHKLPYLVEKAKPAEYISAGLRIPLIRLARLFL